MKTKDYTFADPFPGRSRFSVTLVARRPRSSPIAYIMASTIGAVALSSRAVSSVSQRSPSANPVRAASLSVSVRGRAQPRCTRVAVAATPSAVESSIDQLRITRPSGKYRLGLPSKGRMSEDTMALLAVRASSISDNCTIKSHLPRHICIYRVI